MSGAIAAAPTVTRTPLITYTAFLFLAKNESYRGHANVNCRLSGCQQPRMWLRQQRERAD
jgi:hypothetical protein